MESMESDLESETLEDFTMRILKTKFERKLRADHKLTERNLNSVSPLKEEVVMKKIEMRDKVRKIRTRREEEVKETSSEEEDSGKENAGALTRNTGIRSSAKSTLKRLGALYAEGDLSSPIHRTEPDFFVSDEQGPSRSAKASARTARLAALASSINQWEDDLSHPVIVRKEEEKRDRFGNIVGQKSVRVGGCRTDATIESPPGKRSRNQPTDEGGSNEERRSESAKKARSVVKGGDGEKGGHTPWDRNMISTLEAQGFSRCESNQHLVYDYKDSGRPVQCLSPSKEKIGSPLRSVRQTSLEKEVQPATIYQPPTPVRSVPSPVRRAVSPRKPVEPTMLDIPLVRTTRVPEPPPLRKSPEKSPRKNTAVLEMAAQYESSSSPPKTSLVKDPAELTIAERKALFEKNGGVVPLPKAPLTMAVPSKVLENKVSHLRIPEPGKNAGRLGARKMVWETREVVSPRKTEEESGPRDQVKEEIAQRQREIEELRNKWNRNKAIASASSQEHDDRQKPAVKEVTWAPGVGKEVEKLPARVPSPPMLPPPPPPPLPMYPLSSSPSYGSPERSQYRSPASDCYPSLHGVKKIRVSPPKPGHLYPSISDIETETESEPPESRYDSSCEDESDHSLGEEIVQVALAAKRQSQSALKRDNSCTSSDESRVLQEIDDFLDEALGEPSPPKKTRDDSFEEQIARGMVSYPSGSCQSDSFEYSKSRMETSDEEAEQPKSPKSMQLVHTISFYRKQQNALPPKQVPSVRREVVVETTVSNGNKLSEREREEEQVSKKIHDLLLEVSRQQTIIAQATQALNYCSSRMEFTGSAEQIEAEKLLLIATNKRQACHHELQRLRIEKTIRPAGGSIDAERGDLTIEQLSLPVKTDAVRLAAREEECFYVMCLVKSGATVLNSEMLPAVSRHLRDGRLVLSKPVTLPQLYSDFMVTVEVYTLRARLKELIPHDVKYHITPKKEKARKGGKVDVKMMSAVESPGGPNVVRSPSFHLAGFVVFSLRDLAKNQFTLNKVPYGSVIEGSVQMKLRSDLSMETQHRGFLTMFEDVSGFGAWHRRWCLLHQDKISYWKYPEDEKKKVALDSLDLSQCITREVGLVSRDVCARPNTILIETKRPGRPGDTESLTTRISGDATIIRHLLSADTKEERVEWCNQINKTLTLLRAWNKQC